MKQKLRFYLAELGTETDYEKHPLDHMRNQLLSNRLLAYGQSNSNGKWRGFREAETFEEHGCVIGSYYWETSPPTRRVLIRTRDGEVKRSGFERDVGEISLMKRGHAVVYNDIRGIIFLNIPAGEAFDVARNIARGVFRYPKDKGFLACKISDEGMERLKNLGKTYEEELRLAGVLKVDIKSIGRKSLAIHIDKLTYLDSEGKPSPIEEERDRFTKIGTDLRLHLGIVDDESYRTRLSEARQVADGTYFTLEGNLPSDEDLDDIGVVRDLAQVVRSFVDLLIEKKVIVRQLHKMPGLTKYKAPGLDTFSISDELEKRTDDDS